MESFKYRIRGKKNAPIHEGELDSARHIVWFTNERGIVQQELEGRFFSSYEKVREDEEIGGIK